MKTVTVTIKKDGGAVVETSGFKGKECMTATAQLEAALGNTTSNNPTAEYNLRPDDKVTVTR